jgi:hypothetical protein
VIGSAHFITWVAVQVAEVRLARFVEEMVVPPNMIDTIVDGEVGSLIYSLLFCVCYAEYDWKLDVTVVVVVVVESINLLQLLLVPVCR